MCQVGSTSSLVSSKCAAGGTGGHTSREFLGQVGVDGGGTASRVDDQSHVGSCDQGTYVGAGVAIQLEDGLQDVCSHGNATRCSSHRVDDLQQRQF